MKILVITPTLGASRWLEETVASVTALRLDCVHALVAPATTVPELAARFPRMTVVAEPDGNRGMYAAINAGLAAVREWDAVTYINDDDVLLPGFTGVARELERSGPGPWAAYGSVRLIDAAGRRLGSIPISPDPTLNRALYAQRLEPVYQHGTLISRAAMDALGGFDASLKFCGDSEILARACVAGIPFRRVGVGAVAAFRLRTGQLTKNRAALLAERAQVDAKLGLLAGVSTMRRLTARLIFRTANLPIYVERVARHGFVSFDELLARPEPGS